MLKCTITPYLAVQYILMIRNFHIKKPGVYIVCLGVSYDSPELGFRAQNRLNSIKNATNSYDFGTNMLLLDENFRKFQYYKKLSRL